MKLRLLIKGNKDIMNRSLLSKHGASVMSIFFISEVLCLGASSQCVCTSVIHLPGRLSVWAAFRDTSFLLLFLTDFSKHDMCIGLILRISIGIIYG